MIFECDVTFGARDRQIGMLVVVLEQAEPGHELLVAFWTLERSRGDRRYRRGAHGQVGGAWRIGG